MYIKRHMEQLLEQITGQYPVLLVTGPRQVGKTTMLEHLAQKEGRGRETVTLDDLTVRELAKTDPKMFFQLHKPPLLIDEVQYAPELFPYIKMMVDSRRQPGDFWLTGSQLFSMMEGVQESLAGRVALLQLSPLSYGEIMEDDNTPPFRVELSALTERQSCRTVLDTPAIFQRIFTGGMPALVSGQYANPNIFYSSYISTYLDRDVRRLSAGIDDLKFLGFLRAAAARAGQQVNYKGIADDAEIDQATAKSWLHILETLGIVFLLRPYSNNVLKRTVSTPKLYFYDTGLVCYLTRWSSPETAMNGAMNGALLENYTVSEIVKTYQNAGQEPFLYYYRDKDAREIDLLLEQMWQEDKKCFAPNAEIPSLCLRCGKPLNRRLVVNALSRYADVHICENCGMDEALRDACGQVLPMWEWYAFSCGGDLNLHSDGPTLTTACGFCHIYDGPKKQFPLNHLEHPVSELVYSRSDYDGRRWWTTWHHGSEERTVPELAEEIDQFTEALLQLPEFKTLDTMTRFCRASAQPTNDSTEFNSYAATEHFYIWLRMITRVRDYNLYCHFYLKEAADNMGQM